MTMPSFVVEDSGLDFTLPAGPPLTQPPLDLLDLSIKLVDTQNLTEQLRLAVEKAASAQEQLADLDDGMQAARSARVDAQTTLEELTDEERDQPGAADAVADADRLLLQLESEYAAAETLSKETEAWASDLAARLAALSRWEQGFVYLPELSNEAGVSIFVNGSGDPVTDKALKVIGSNQAPAGNPFYWYDPFVIVGRDARSTFGWPHTDFESRAQRAMRALDGHDSWQVEQEFWSGEDIPTNYHLTASPNTPTTSPNRVLTGPWPNPTPAPGTVLGVAVGLADSLAALDQAIAESDAGTGMIHATPFIMQSWMKTYPFIRDPGDPGVYTVNHNLMVPGYGYCGTGPDQASRSETDGDGATGAISFTSASAAFTANDIGRPITETSAYGVIPPGTYIEQVLSPTNVLLSQEMTSTHGSIHFTIAGLGGRAGGALVQWAYATERTYTLNGDVNTYPFDLREMSPLVTVENSADVRAEQSWAVITNRLLRAAVLVDTTQP